MGVFLSRLWTLKIFRRGGATPIPRGSDSDSLESCGSLITCSTLDNAESESNGFYPHSNLLQLSPSPNHGPPIQKLNQDLLLR